jgi:hypothetical protein
MEGDVRVTCVESSSTGVGSCTGYSCVHRGVESCVEGWIVV